MFSYRVGGEVYICMHIIILLSVFVLMVIEKKKKKNNTKKTHNINARINNDEHSWCGVCECIILFYALGSRHVFWISVSANLLIIIPSTSLHTLRYLTNVWGRGRRVLVHLPATTLSRCVARGPPRVGVLCT